MSILPIKRGDVKRALLYIDGDIVLVGEVVDESFEFVEVTEPVAETFMISVAAIAPALSVTTIFQLVSDVERVV